MTRRRKPAESTLRQRAEASAMNRFTEAAQQAAADLDISPDDERCTQVAALRMQREVFIAQMLRGERTDPTILLKIDDALRQYLPERDPLQVEVSVVEGVTGLYRCKCCGEENRLEPGTYEPIERPKPTPKPDALPSAAIADASSAPSSSAVSQPDSTPPALPNDKVVPLVEYAVRRAPTNGSTYDPFGSEYHKGGY